MNEHEDRYNRLKNVKEFGYDIDWEELRDKTAAIIGVGGLGSVAAEMLARCGIGTLQIFDLDIVNEVNLNRMFFRNAHIGQNKVDVVANVLNDINPDVGVVPHQGDIMAWEFEDDFEDILRSCDIVIQGLDNLPARQYLNAKCVKLLRPFIDAGASRSGMGGYVQPVLPGRTACNGCVGAVNLEQKKEQGEVCTASLPTTMTILAGLEVQEALKYLLHFGSISGYLMYDAITNIITHYLPTRDPNCPVCAGVTCEEGSPIGNAKLRTGDECV
ncbi:MAG TPA: ThiF family adenylyltransferase [Candidatus Lokiarchaeia archaeon]|nr:ThiF family adenylyltransferase [Candidatus Lokiarchaeia archaeon]